MIIATSHIPAPHVDFAALSPLIALLGGAVLVLMVGLLGARAVRHHGVPLLTIIALGAVAGLTIWQWQDERLLMYGQLRIDGLSLTSNLLLVAAGIAAVLLAWRSEAGHEAAHGELHALLLSSIAGMSLLVSAQSTVILFLGLELLSIPLYVMCAAEMRREHSLEAGLKYLILGSVGSATLLYGLALIYGVTGATGFASISHAIGSRSLSSDVMLLGGIALSVAGFCFKSSVAPFHQWTPDVYEGAPTPITAFMAVATKVAALGAMLRFFDVALIEASGDWAPALAVLAAVTIIVGNVGALGQSSLKRMLAYSSVGQAGYMLAGVVVSSALGVRATVFYLAVYLFMNLAAFAVIVARERETNLGDSIDAIAGLGRQRPSLAWPLTLSMLGLAGLPATAGFVGKFYLIEAAVKGSYTWLGVVIVIGSMISLAYYLPVVAAMWAREAPSAGGDDVEHAATVQGSGGPLPAIAGGSQELTADGEGERRATPGAAAHAAAHGSRLHFEVALVAVLAGAATLFFGIVPQPLLNLVAHASRGLGLF